MLKSKRGKRIGLLDESVVDFRVLPNDCDLYFHMNNARYTNIAVLGRVYHLGKVGIDKPLLKRRWFPIIFASETIHIKPIKPFKKYTLKTKMLTWDEKYWYFQHLFEMNRIIHAINMTMGVMVNKGKIVPINKIVEELELSINPPELPNKLKKWKELHEIIKRPYKQ